MDDSLMRALLAEPGRFMKYVDMRNVHSRKDFIDAVREAFDTRLGHNFLNAMTVQHWKFLLSLPQVKKQISVTTAASTAGDDLIIDLVKKEGAGAIKYIEVTMRNGNVYKRSFQSWTDKQKMFVTRYATLSKQELFEMYNKTFKLLRTSSSISTMLYRIRKSVK